MLLSAVVKIVVTDNALVVPREEGEMARVLQHPFCFNTLRNRVDIFGTASVTSWTPRYISAHAMVRRTQRVVEIARIGLWFICSSAL